MKSHHRYVWLLVILLLSAAPLMAQHRPTRSKHLALVYAQNSETQTTIWAVPPDDLNRPTLLYSIPNTAGWGGNVSISPDSRFLAFVRIVDGTIQRPGKAELAVYDFSTMSLKIVDDAVYPLSPVVWAPDNTTMAFLAAGPSRDLSMPGPITTINIKSNERFALPLEGQQQLPIGWTAQNDLLYYQASTSTHDIILHKASQTTPLYTSNNDTGLLDFAISDDRNALAFLKAGSTWSLVTINLSTGISTTAAESKDELYQPLISSSAIYLSVSHAATLVTYNHRLIVHRGPSTGATLSRTSPDGELQIIVSISPDQRFQVIRDHARQSPDRYAILDTSSGLLSWLPLNDAGNDTDIVGWLTL